MKPYMESYALAFRTVVACPGDVDLEHVREDVAFVWTRLDYANAVMRMAQPSAPGGLAMPLRTVPVGDEYVAHYYPPLPGAEVPAAGVHYVARRLGLPAWGEFWITRRDRGLLPVAACYGNPLAVAGLVLDNAARLAKALTVPPPLFAPAVEQLVADTIERDDRLHGMLRERVAAHPARAANRKRATGILAKRAADAAVPADGQAAKRVAGAEALAQ